jgi:hypothetical protein
MRVVCFATPRYAITLLLSVAHPGLISLNHLSVPAFTSLTLCPISVSSKPNATRTHTTINVRVRAHNDHRDTDQHQGKSLRTSCRAAV